MVVKGYTPLSERDTPLWEESPEGFAKSPEGYAKSPAVCMKSMAVIAYDPAFMKNSYNDLKAMRTARNGAVGYTTAADPESGILETTIGPITMWFYRNRP